MLSTALTSEGQKMDQSAYDNYMSQLLEDDVSLRPPSAQPYRQTEGPVQSVDFLVRANAKEHHTDMYDLVRDELQRPVFRRGQHFRIQILFKIPFQLTKNSLRLDFSFGWDPLPGNGTLVHIPVSNSTKFPSNQNWGLRMRSRTKTSLIVDVMTSPTAPVGVWRMAIVSQPRKLTFDVQQHFYILFNPWCKDDLVYMEREQRRKEYVINDYGMIFVGKYPEIQHMDWLFSQFLSVTLPAAICMLEKTKVKVGARGNPIELSRVITRLVRELVLEGRWKGSFDDGVEPLKWKGSGDILRQFMDTNQRVKYGQCWNFAGLTCSISRALGIPCRVVTNFESAHAAENDQVIEIYKDANGNIVQNGDAVWDFRVWNDVWMARPDLPEGFGGWQAIDITQRKENTESVWCECGPASLNAVKGGESAYRYDTLAIFSAVNADRKVWQINEDKSKVFSSMDEAFVGKCVITKAVGKDDHRDVTSHYKFKEGTKEERLAIANAAELSGKEDKFSKPQSTRSPENVFFDLIKTDSVVIGKPLQLAIVVENRSRLDRIVSVSLGAKSIEYNGDDRKQLDISGNPSSGDMLYRQRLKLAPGKKEMITTPLKPEIYIDKMSYLGHIRIYASGVVKETNQTWFMDGGAFLQKPELKIEMNDKFQVEQVINLKLKFSNPLDRELSKCSFDVEGSCTPDTVSIDFRNIKPNEDVIHPIQMIPEKRGPALILAVFNSDLLKNVSGSKKVIIR